MIIGIDATNIRSGGGLTHLREILNNAEPHKFGIQKIIVWSNNLTLSKLPSEKWLIKKSHSWLNSLVVKSFLFQIFLISKKAHHEKCNLLFIPGGTFLGRFSNFVTMSQNMLPFEKIERNRFDRWETKLRFRILKKTQSYTFKKSKAVIFLTHYAKNYIEKNINLQSRKVVISHGINLDFLQKPKQQLEIDKYTYNDPYKFLYVSTVTAYKHQSIVVEAILKLRNEGWPITLQLVGDNRKYFLEKLNKVLDEDIFKCIEYKGKIEYEALSAVYKNADGFIFASSCENQPIILLEAMTSGLPIVCSNMGPMPEVLGDAGFYFDPLNVQSIYESLKVFLNNKEDRQLKAKKAYKKSIDYSWKECSDRTFDFLSSFKKE